MTLYFALRNGWELVRLNYDAAFALVERRRADGLRERALALRINEADSRRSSSFAAVRGGGAWEN
jgi:YD repeat-containing protein